MSGARVQFDRFVADLNTGEVWRDGARLPLQDLPFRVLAVLLDRPGDLVTREELVARLWGPETFVDAEAGLNTAVAKLRQALRTGADDGTLIETIPRRGYRLTANVERVVATPESASFPERPREFSPSKRPWTMAALALAVLSTLATTAYVVIGREKPIRIAVALFDNETGRSELDPFAQRLTDITVAALTSNQRLTVIGNAAVLRTTRPFRDVELIRATLDADFVIVGQVQAPDEKLRVVAHVIRATDQSHVSIAVIPAAERPDVDVEREVAGRVASALAGHVS